MSSSVLLGALDEPTNQANTDWSTNKIGGRPDWMTTIDIPSCQECNNNMILVLQLYCPLEGSVYHRTLYLFTCLKCTVGRWKLVRQQKEVDSKIKTAKKPIPSNKSSGDDWGVKTDEWGTDSDDWGVKSDDWGTDSDDWGIKSDDWGMNGNDWGMDTNTSSNSCNDKIAPEPVPEKSYSNAVKSNLEKSENNSSSFEGTGYVNESKSQIEKLNGDNPKDTEGSLTSNFSNMEIQNSDDSFESLGQSSDVLAKDDMIDNDRIQNVMTLIQKSGDSHVTDVTCDQCLLSYYISVVEEPEDILDSGQTEHIKNLLKNYQKEQGVIEEQASASGSNSSGEKYEKSTHNDKYFHKFSKRIGRSPEQIIRYEWNGSPLYISRPEPELLKMSQQTCQHCGGGLVFELQVLPALINSLKFNETKDTGIEFGTVIIYTCKASCWTDKDSCRIEHVFIQADPDQHLFKKIVNKND